MFQYLAKKIFGGANDRVIKAAQKIIPQINTLELDMKALSSDELRGKTEEFKKRVASGEGVDALLPEAFAVAREGAWRVLNMRHFDEQLLGGIILHHGKIAEMKTGEGKTLVATAPVYLNALAGKGVHVVTVNDYLAKRDAEWMGRLYEFLGLSVGCIVNSMTGEMRKQAYLADITYGTNNEFGFDYLRDNLKYDLDEIIQRPFNYAIVDEVDSILIDEARTPLVISGPTADTSDLYRNVDNMISLLTDDDLEIDEKSKLVNLTEKGQISAEKVLKKHSIITKNSSLYDFENMAVLHHLNQSLRAHKMFKRDVDYIIKSGQAMIIDEFTGRIMDGRRYSEGLHQAIEAKEKIKIQNENQTLASVTFQNYFRMYPKLAGMTGTAMTEAAEFADIYHLDVVAIPTHLPVKRIDDEDEIYKTAEEKYDAIVEAIKKAHTDKQPVLVGTVSIEKSEHLSRILKKAKIKHKVLNARYHEQEAEIIAQAGQIGAVTIATNMAGRGTDIMLGGNEKMMAVGVTDVAALEKIQAKILSDREKVLSSGGLFVIGTERHESRRIDNQLRGRSGRQGDVGRTKFFLSLEDDLMRLFGTDKIGSMLTKLGLKKGEAIMHPWISRSLAKAQQKVEMRNYEIRKNLLKYDDVVNEQRKFIYTERTEVMKNSHLCDMLFSMTRQLMPEIIKKYILPKTYKEEWNIADLEKELGDIYNITIDLSSVAKQEGVGEAEIAGAVSDEALKQIKNKESLYGAEKFNHVICRIFLQVLDQLWREHLHALEYLRGGISLRAYAQKDPLNEYKIEAFQLFRSMRSKLDELVVAYIMSLDATEQDSKMLRQENDLLEEEQPIAWQKVSRNATCPCGSGKKFKHCHGAIE